MILALPFFAGNACSCQATTFAKEIEMRQKVAEKYNKKIFNHESTQKTQTVQKVLRALTPLSMQGLTLFFVF